MITAKKRQILEQLQSPKKACPWLFHARPILSCIDTKSIRNVTQEWNNFQQVPHQFTKTLQFESGVLLGFCHIDEHSAHANKGQFPVDDINGF